MATLAPPSAPSASTPTPTNQTSADKITKFGQDETVRYLLDKWLLNFDSNVEIRYFIGDQSIQPRRGQFLVVWFMQIAADATPIPLGGFELRVLNLDSDKLKGIYKVSKEGTAALALTEFDWSPRLMESGIPYRTGVVFDIRPEDVHFRLQYRVPSREFGEGPESAVDIEFNA